MLYKQLKHAKKRINKLYDWNRLIANFIDHTDWAESWSQKLQFTICGYLENGVSTGIQWRSSEELSRSFYGVDSAVESTR